MAQQNIKSENLEDQLKSIELRLANLESALALNKLRQPAVDTNELQKTESSSVVDVITDEEKGLESRFGRVGLAWLGNIVLLFAIVFFTEYITFAPSFLLSTIP